MAGVHIRYRKTRLAKYSGAYAKLQLPSKIASDYKMDTIPDKKDNKIRRKSVCPEFFLGFYTENYNHGLDIGLFFDHKDREFKMCINAYAVTMDSAEESSHIFGKTFWKEEIFPRYMALPGDEVVLDTYINYTRREIIMLVIDERVNRRIGQIRSKLSKDALRAFSKGCIINRELNLASNLNDNKYAPSAAFCSTVCFKELYLDEVNGKKNILMTDANSEIHPTKNEFDDSTNSKIKPTKAFDFKGYSKVLSNGAVYDYMYMDCRQPNLRN